MKKLLSFALLSALLIGSLTACGRTLKTCKVADLDGTIACYDEKLEQYAVEADAALVVSVDNNDWGAAIVALWDAAHPEAAGAVTFVNDGSQGSTDRLATQLGDYADVFIAIDGEITRNAQHLLPFDKTLADIVKANSVETYYKTGNTGEVTVYAPMLYDGMAFVWNKTMLTTLGLNVTDADGDNLPDAYDTWEEIFALSASWHTGDRPIYKGNPIKIAFPLTLNNQWSDFHHLSSAGWQLFKNGPLDPGYDDPEFKAGFQFTEDAKAAFISVDIAEDGTESLTAGAGMGWRWDDVINSESAPFGLLGTWMNLAGAETSTGSDFIVSALPTYKGEHQATFVKTKGIAVNAYTEFQSAAHELARLIYSMDGFQAMVDHTSYPPSLADGSDLVPSLTAGGVQEQMMKGFLYSASEYVGTLPNNKNQTAMGAAYYQAFLNDAQISVWDGTKTIDQAIADLITVSDAALAAANVAP